MIGSVSWREERYCVLDFETTGLDPFTDQILSFGLVPIDGGRIVTARARYGLVRAEAPVPARSILVHSLRDADLADAPTLAESLDTIFDALEGRILVAHAAWIERGFLEQAALHAGRRARFRVIDTAVLAHACLELPRPPRGQSIALEYLGARLGLPIHTPHNALGDAMTTAQVFLALSSRLSTERPVSAHRLVALSRARRYAA
jgi:DNA polymerase III epsilon subunit family exonuclease